ncbi:MAG: hypothetical protein K2N09_09235 [Muribaculaceae bacterium]|nr:hypothetical protein [Muribaculaceae bacterium]
MIHHIPVKVIAIGFLAAAISLFPSCSTGIESTKKIRMTKEDIKLMSKSPEQEFSESIQGIPLSAWEKGKRFMALSDRTLYIFEPSGLNATHDNESLKGKTLTFIGLDSHINPDLREECVILFSDGKRTLRYRTGKSTEEAIRGIDSSKIPLISDLALIEQWKEKICGKTFWTRSNLWYDANGDRLPGLKYAKIKVEEVMPATGDFPINVAISGPDGKIGYLHMNYTSDTHDSRNFAAIFFLNDPKNKYPHVTDENWSLIQQGKVGNGMTKEECKLSIGNPDEVRSGHNRSQTMDIWQYSDGTYLMFTDGLLTNFRQ